jgi:hypothetical protein
MRVAFALPNRPHLDFEVLPDSNVIADLRRSPLPSQVTVMPDGSLVVHLKGATFKTFFLVAGISILPHLRYATPETVRKWILDQAVAFIPETAEFLHLDKLPRGVKYDDPKAMMFRWLKAIEYRSDRKLLQWLMDGWLEVTAAGQNNETWKPEDLVPNPFRGGSKSAVIFMAIREAAHLGMQFVKRSQIQGMCKQTSDLQISDADIKWTVEWFDPSHKSLDAAMKKYPKLGRIHGMIKFADDNLLEIHPKLVEKLFKKEVVVPTLTGEFSNLSRHGNHAAIHRNEEGWRPYDNKFVPASVSSGEIDDRPSFLRAAEDAFLYATSYESKMDAIERISEFRRVVPGRKWIGYVPVEVTNLAMLYAAYVSGKCSFEEVFAAAEMVSDL